MPFVCLLESWVEMQGRRAHRTPQPCGGSFPAAETCAENPRRAHGGQRRMRLSMGDRHPHGAPWPRTSDGHHMVGSRAVQRGPADLKSVRQENDGARMGARDLRASQGKAVGRDYPILDRSIRSRVIAYERADERSRVKPHGRHPADRRAKPLGVDLADCAEDL